MLTLYGITNCDTVKKARKWLEKQGIAYNFHDFKKEGITEEIIQSWMQSVPAEELINRRGTTWRKLSETDKARAETNPAKLMEEHPTLIKRPVILLDTGEVTVGFSPQVQAGLAA